MAGKQQATCSGQCEGCGLGKGDRQLEEGRGGFGGGAGQK